MKSCWIYCGAPSESFYLKPPDDSFVIAADSGYNILKVLEITPNILLGDFDSLTSEIPNNCEIITAPAEKDDTDTMLAVKTALLRGYYDITLVSSIGGRLDHTFANIQTLAYISDKGGIGKLIGKNDIVYFCEPGIYYFNTMKEAYFSVFSYTESALISLTGTKYPLSNYRLTNTFPLGVSNEIISSRAQLNVNDGQTIVIFSKKFSTNLF